MNLQVDLIKNMLNLYSAYRDDALMEANVALASATSGSATAKAKFEDAIRKAADYQASINTVMQAYGPALRQTSTTEEPAE